MSSIVVVGAGNWGTTVAALLASNGRDCTLWFRSEEHCQKTRDSGFNEDYLPDVPLPKNLALSTNPDLFSQAEDLILALPCNALRGFLETYGPQIRPQTGILSLAKGMETSTGFRPTEIIQKILPEHYKVAALSGPNIASEIARGKPATAVIASSLPSYSQHLQKLMATETFRTYTNPDVLGVEICGALKNIIAIGAGVCQELDLGDNALAALITRGIAEISRYGHYFGANPMTFMGMAGVGDLTVTCMSRHSRNNRLGHLLARGATLEEARAQTRMVTEGVHTCRTVVKIAQEHNIYMPICSAVGQLLFEGIKAEEAIQNLMQNSLRPEMDRIQ